MTTRMVEGSESSSRQLDQYTLLAKEIVRPSSPTPSHLKTYNLSLYDQFNPSVYISNVFFYPNNALAGSNEVKAAQLKKSLSETLTQYYPFSGRLVAATNGAAYVDCNDEGVDFLEVQSDTSLSKLVVMYNLEYQPFDQLFPTGTTGWDRSKGWGSIVMVQLTYFTCGGIALAVSLCHKIGDGSTFFTFLNHWAAVNQRHLSVVNDKVQPLPPHFVSSSEADFSSFQECVLNKGNNCVTKKFVFPNSKLAELKDKVKEINPTRIEVLTSLLYGCAVRAAMANSRGHSFKGYILTHSVNVRKRMVNPLPDTYVGNMVKAIILPTMKESELSMNSLTARIKNAKLQLWGVTNAQVDEYAINSAGTSKNVTSEYDFGVYASSSFCGFPAYEVDFGWGKPVRMSIAECAMKNLFILLDTPNGDGIEAVVSLEKQDMDIFEKDKQLLAFAL